eukprot:6208400-Pleurochrysis_carterae.AAC.2
MPVAPYMGYEWTKEEEEALKVKAVVGKVVADGQMAYACPTRAVSQQALSFTVSCENLGSELLSEYEQSLAADAAADEASARKDTELIDLEESERMPAV